MDIDEKGLDTDINDVVVDETASIHDTDENSGDTSHEGAESLAVENTGLQDSTVAPEPYDGSGLYDVLRKAIEHESESVDKVHFSHHANSPEKIVQELRDRLENANLLSAEADNEALEDSDEDALIDAQQDDNAQDNPHEGRITPEERFKGTKPSKVSQLKAKFYLVYQDFLDVFRKPKPQSKPRSTKDKISVKVEREQLYSQFLNKLLMLLLNGVAVGALLLAAMDYLANAQVPERNSYILPVFLIIAIVNLVYWWRTYKDTQVVEGLKSVALIALAVSIVGTSAGVYDVYQNQTNLNTYFYGEKMAIKDRKDTAVLLASYINTWRHTPNYSIVQIAEDVHYAVVYNSEGESLAQLILPSDYEENTEDLEGHEGHDHANTSASNVVVTLKDGTAVVVTEEKIERRLEVDNLKYVELALQWAAKDKATLTRHSPTMGAIQKDNAPLDGLPGTEYVVDIVGITRIKEFYSSVLGSVAAEDMFKALATVGDNVTLSFQVSLDNAYIGAASYITVDGEENLLWFIDNYIEAYDWTLGLDDWYKYDYRDAKKNEQMIETALINASSMMERLGEALGLTE